MEKVDSLDVTPVIDNKPVPHGELVGDVLSVISLKDVTDDTDPDRVVKRNSFRDLHHPNISHLNWVLESHSKDEAVMEKVRSFHSHHSIGASGHDMVVGSHRGLAHAQSHSTEPIREESQENMTPQGNISEKPPVAAVDIDHEYLIRRVTLGELDYNEIAAIRERFGGLLLPAANANKDSDSSKETLESSTVSSSHKTTESTKFYSLTITQPLEEPSETSAVESRGNKSSSSMSPAAVDDEASDERGQLEMKEYEEEKQGVRLQETQQRAVDETMQTYCVVDDDEQRGQEQHLEQERRKQEEQEQEKEQGEQKETKKEVEKQESSKKGGPAGYADNLKTKVMAIPDAGKRVPLSESAIRAADAVNVDMLDRAISEDLSQLSDNCSLSVCQLAAIIVSRVMDSARSRVLREDRLSPATTWTEKARCQAVLLVEDVVSSAMIYVSRGAPATSTKPPSRVVHVTDDAAVSEQPLHQPADVQHQPAELLMDDDHDEVSDEEDSEIDRRAEAVRNIQETAKRSLLQAPSVIAQLSIIQSPRQSSAEQHNKELKKDADQRDRSARTSLTDRISIILPSSFEKLPAPEQEDTEKKPPLQKLAKRRASVAEEVSIIPLPPDESSEELVGEEEGKLKTAISEPFSLAQLSIIQHVPIAGEPSHESLPPTSGEAQSILRAEASHATNEDSTDDRLAIWHQLLGRHPRSSVATVHEDDHIETTPDVEAAHPDRPRPAWRELFTSRQSKTEDADNTDR